MFNKTLLKEIQSELTSGAAIIVFGVILGGFIIVQAWILSTIISKVFLEHNTIQDIFPLLLALLSIIFGRGLALFGREISSGAVSIRIRDGLKRKLFDHLQQISPILVSPENTGEITTTIIQGVDRLDAYFRTYLPQLFIATILPILILWVVFPMDWISGLILLLTAPLIPFFMILVGKQAEKETNRQWNLLRRLGGHFFEVLQGLETLKTFGLSKSQGKIIKTVSDEYAKVTLKVLRITFLSALTLELLATISTAVIAVQIGIRLLYGQIEFRDSLMILILAPDFYLPLRQLGAAFHSGMEGVQAAKRIYEILTFPVMVEPIKSDYQGEYKFQHIDVIKFHEVGFSYQMLDQPSLNGVSFCLSENSKTVLVGRAGSGKSTIISLLLKFIQPDEGMITLSGKNLQEINCEYWRQQIAWMPQFPYLFNDSVANNILLSKPSASFAEVIIAAKHALIHEFITSLPDGYDTKIGDKGATLSGGQAQRLAIARAFLRNAPILIMDEPTQNLDSENQVLIDKAVTHLIKHKTVLIAAHRLSSIRAADKIIVLDKGKIVQFGGFDDLLAEEGLFRSLVLRTGVEQ